VQLPRLSRQIAYVALGTALLASLTPAARSQGSAPASPPPANSQASSTGSEGGGWSPDFSLAARVGTPGFGAQADLLLFSHLGIRAGFNDFNFTLNHSIKSVQFNGKLGLETFPILADFYPWGRGTFHLTGGVVINKNKFTATGQPTSGTYTFNGNSYDAAQVGSVSAQLTYPTSGYVGLGWGTPAMKSRVGFIFDLGAIIGTPTFSLTSTNPTNNAQLTADLQQQQATSQKDVQKYAKIYPVISMGIAVRI
jgi:hypothetical protein